MIIRLSPTGGNFFAAVKSFDTNIAISGNFVLNAKNSTKFISVVKKIRDLILTQRDNQELKNLGRLNLSTKIRVSRVKVFALWTLFED